MKPVLFSIGEISVLAYPVIIVLAIILAVVVVRYYEIPGAKKILGEKFPENIFKYNGEVFLIAFICIIIGGRLAYVIVNPHLYAGDPVRILEIWRGGFAYHGGLILSIIAAALHARFRRMPPGMLLDLAIPYVALAYGFGRIACFLNGCCYGKVSDVPWAVAYPAIDGLARHPTQLYASAASILIFAVLILMNRRRFRAGEISNSGVVFAWFLVLHGIYRFVVEYFRVSEEYFGPLTQAQAVSLLLILAGAAFIVLKKPVKTTKGG